MTKKRISLVVAFIIWVAGSYAVYSFLPRWAIVVYGVVTIGLVLWLAGRSTGNKPQVPNG